MERLQKLISVQGKVGPQAPRLRKLQQAIWVYYDLNNNGLINRFREVRTVIGVTPKHFGVHYRHRDGGLYRPDFLIAIERRMDEIVLEAADEQGVVIVEFSAHQRLARFAQARGVVAEL